jgi:hypothetical protein
MTEDEMTQLQVDIIEMCDAIIEKYDWDRALEKYLEAQ